MTALLLQFGPWLFGALGIVGGILFGSFRHQQAKAATADAAAVKAQAEQVVAQKQSQVDQVNAAASAAGEQAVVNRAEADKTAAAAAQDDIDAQLAAISALRKE